jgi:predicted  nucleic acid-binding Zn-ribbon protein
MENVETILEGLLELVRLDIQLRKTGKETAERRQVEDAINSVRAKVAEPILRHFDRQKSRGKLGIAPVRGGVCGACHLKMPLGLSQNCVTSRMISPCVITAAHISICLRMKWLCRQCRQPAVAGVEQERP